MEDKKMTMTVVGTSARKPDMATLCATDCLYLAAAPTFAVMALVTGILDAGSNDILCSAVRDASPFSGMAVMYVLMSVFHSAPWLKLISGPPCGPYRP